jgi:hypothetical protein
MTTPVAHGPKRAVVHIGIHKTGTTTIQRSLFAHRDWLLQRRVLVPSLRANVSAPLLAILGDSTPGRALLYGNGDVDQGEIPQLKDEYRRSLEADFRREDYDALVISAESLSLGMPEVAERLAAWLKDLGILDIHVLAYVREPADWARSVAQERLKHDHTLEDSYGQVRAPAWRNKISPWISAFGRSSVSVTSFEDARREGILTTFCRLAGIPQPEPEPGPSNESMSMQAALLLSHLNEVRPAFQDGKRSPNRLWFGMKEIRAIPGTPFVLPDAVRDEVIEGARDEVAWLEETFGLSLYTEGNGSAASYSSAAAANGPAWPDETLDAIAVLLSDLGNQVVRRQRGARLGRQALGRLLASVGGRRKPSA